MIIKFEICKKKDAKDTIPFEKQN